MSVETFGLPGAPTISGIQVTTTSATVSWIAASPRGSMITSYVAQAVGTGLSCIWSTGALSCLINGLESDTNYTFNVIASNAVGDGLPSESETARTSRVSVASQSPAATNVVSATSTSTSTSSTALSPVQSPTSTLAASMSTVTPSQRNRIPETTSTEDAEIIASGTSTTNEEELDEANSDQVLSERRADSGISLELNDEFLLLFLSCLAIVAVGLIIRKSFLQKEK